MRSVNLKKLRREIDKNFIQKNNAAFFLIFHSTTRRIQEFKSLRVIYLDCEYEKANPDEQA
jgi:hypothetical protein